MNTKQALLLALVALGLLVLVWPRSARSEATFPVTHTDEEWKQILKPEQYRVLRQHGTERAFTGAFHAHHEKGVYLCAGCGHELFASTAKFDSGTGWPSYWQPYKPDSVGTTEDRSLLILRTEVHCARCGGHLGHVFPDGPKPSGLRYCINSAALTFLPDWKE